ncbi:MAG: acyl-CoA reductase [Bacteroidota bacterium]
MAWSDLLTPENLSAWFESMPASQHPKTVAIIMAGNIPLVGFHDLISVLATGHRALVKLSSDDEVLMKAVITLLGETDARLKELITIAEGPLKNFDAVIATGSDNTSRYFEHYFGKYPHVIRKNRTSLAVLTGNETKEELELLGDDIFTYFGMGCRNVSHLLVPRGYNFHEFFEAMLVYGDMINHNKYVNNYEYHRAIFLLEQIPFLDNNFLMIREHDELFSPLSVIHYSFYDSAEDITNYILDHSNKIQCVTGNGYLPLGKAQQPALWDYADGVDTPGFLAAL